MLIDRATLLGYPEDVGVEVVVGVFGDGRGNRRTGIFSSFNPSPKIPLTI